MNNNIKFYDEAASNEIRQYFNKFFKTQYIFGNTQAGTINGKTPT
jgi:hypothetical protein